MTHLSTDNTERESTQLDSTTSVQASLISLHESYFSSKYSHKKGVRSIYCCQPWCVCQGYMYDSPRLQVIALQQHCVCTSVLWAGREVYFQPRLKV